MNQKSKIIYFIISVLFFVFFDLWCSNQLLNSSCEIPDNSILDITYVQNTGAAFSILDNAPILLVFFALIAIFAILIYGIKNIDKFSSFACFWTAMLVSGIGCNLYERIVFGYVRDFFNLKMIDFPVFNISDIFINVGVFALVVLIIKNKYIRK